MAGRRQLLTLLMVLLFSVCRAQDEYPKADSTSYSLFAAAKWKELISYSKSVTAEGTDFPMLRLRTAYAQYMSENYTAALQQYQQVLKSDSYNQIARQYSFLCNRLLNRDHMAAFQAPYLSRDSLLNAGITPFGLVQFDAETSVKIPATDTRSIGSYTRAGLSNRLGWKLQLDQSLVYYGQQYSVPVTVTAPGGNPVNVNTTIAISQFEYFGKLSFSPINNFAVFGSGHYLNTVSGAQTQNNFSGTAGIKYFTGVIGAQADVSLSRIAAVPVRQYNAQLSILPFGNLNTYLVPRISYLSQQGSSELIFSGTAGQKLGKKIWMEAGATVGDINNFAEADGLYLYNTLDVTKFKSQLKLYYPLNAHLILSAIYMYETKENYSQSDSDRITKYNQQSITAGILWKF